MRVAGVHQGTYEQAVIRSEELQRLLWVEAEVLGKKHPRESVIGLFIQSVNSLMDLHAKRVMLGMRNHIPGSIWMALYLISSLAMAGMGYHAGLSGSRRSPIIISLALTFSLIILLIADLDLPQEGLIDVSQQSMVDVRNMMAVPNGPGKAPRRSGDTRPSGAYRDVASPSNP
jgi:hypothetical protein